MATEDQGKIVNPHEHDVLSGRGNFVNYHAGNEHFRALVRKHKVDYVKCPKPQKGKFSKVIVDEIKSRNPPGRFLKQDATTKLWYDIGEKKALDKTRQALREGAPDLMKDMTGDDAGSDEGDRGVRKDGYNIIGNPNGTGLPAEMLNNPQFMNNVGGFQSPRMDIPNHLQTSPHLMGISPGLLMNPQLSPGIQQMQQLRGLGNMSQMLSPPQVHRPSLDHISPQEQQMMMMNQQAMNQQAINQQAMNAMQQQQQQYNSTQMELEQAMLVNAKLEQEMQMMQTKLNSMYSKDQGHFEPTPLDVLSNTNATIFSQSQNPQTQRLSPLQAKPKLEMPSGQNTRRKPPPSLLVREESLKLDKLFSSPGSLKKILDPNASSGAISVMDMSIADMQDEDNLSAVFGSTVRINEEKGEGEKKDKNLDALDMSVGDLSESNMSFGNVFEDQYKLE